MTRVMTSTRIGKCDWSQDIRPESYLPSGIGHMTKVRHMAVVTHMTGVVIYLHYKHV
jgi:hypothetical protein